MQIVINIDTVDYEYIKNGCIIPIKVDNHIYDAIRNGTLLPKGHGDLVDVEEVKEYFDNIQQELDGWGETDSAVEIAKARMGLNTVSTTIEADRSDT